MAGGGSTDARSGITLSPHCAVGLSVPDGSRRDEGRTAAAIALWLIRHGFRYVPVTYTGIAFVNFIPFFLRGLLAGSQASRRPRFLRAFSALLLPFYSTTRRGQEPNVRSPAAAARVLKTHPPHRGLQEPNQPTVDALGDRQELIHRPPLVLDLDGRESSVLG